MLEVKKNNNEDRCSFCCKNKKQKNYTLAEPNRGVFRGNDTTGLDGEATASLRLAAVRSTVATRHTALCA